MGRWNQMKEKILEQVKLPEQLEEWTNEALAFGKREALQRKRRKKAGVSALGLFLCILLWSNFEVIAQQIEKLFNPDYGGVGGQIVGEGLGQPLGEKLTLGNGKQMSLDYLMMDEKELLVIARIYDVIWKRDIAGKTHEFLPDLSLSTSPLPLDAFTLNADGGDVHIDEEEQVLYIQYLFRMEERKPEDLRRLFFHIQNADTRSQGSFEVNISEAKIRGDEHEIGKNLDYNPTKAQFDSLYLSPMGSKLMFRYDISSHPNLYKHGYALFSFRLIQEGKECPQNSVQAVYDSASESYTGTYMANFPAPFHPSSRSLSLYLDEIFSEEKVEEEFTLEKHKFFKIRSEQGEDEFLLVKDIRRENGKTMVDLITNSTFLDEADFYIDGQKAEILNDVLDNATERETGSKDEYREFLSAEDQTLYADYYQNRNKGPDLISHFTLEGNGKEIRMKIQKITHRIKVEEKIFEME